MQQPLVKNKKFDGWSDKQRQIGLSRVHATKKLKRSKTKEGNTIEVLKTNATLMGKMLIALRSRDGNLDDFFASEIQSYATSLSDFGKLHLPAKKSEIVDLLLHDEIENLPSTYHGKILDGAAIVHMLKTGTATTFSEYSVCIHSICEKMYTICAETGYCVGPV